MKFLRLHVCCFVLAVLVAGCSGSGGDNGIANNNGGSNNGGPPPNAQNANSLFAPAGNQTSIQPIVPFPDDILFADATNATGVPGFTPDGTLNVPNPTSQAPVDNLDMLDGWSTTDNIYTDIAGPIDLASANSGGIVLISDQGQSLKPGTDFRVVQSSVVTDHTRLLIQPLKPLKPASTYVVVLTNKLRTASGGVVLRSDSFKAVASPDPVGSANNPATGFTPQQQAVLESVRESQIQPLINNVINLSSVINIEDVSLLWSFTTQSIGDSLDTIVNNPTPNPGSANDGGIRVTPFPNANNQMSVGGANIYQGTVDLSYYLGGSQANPLPALSTFWQSTNNNVGGNSALTTPGGGSLIPCNKFTQSESTTKCYPTPAVQSVQTVPVLVAVPQGNAPSGGWPVVIFQHGITANRTNILAVAPALAAAGFVTVAIDLPLHGVEPQDQFSQFRIDGNERTFDLDVQNNATGAPAPDGTPDNSGSHFINLQSTITSRDNSREAVADLIDLNATLRADQEITVTGGTAIPLNGQPSQYLGHSLGAIVGGVLMGVTDNTSFNAATLANPGGGVIRLLDGSAAFGPQISAGLGASGAPEGSEAYEAFLRIAQTVNDSADPVNYASAASKKHPLHLIEIVGGANNGNNPPDLVVPNAVPRNVSQNFAAPPSTPGACPATIDSFTPTLDTVCVSGPLSGTDPLVAALGLNTVTVSPPFAPSTQPADTVVRFTSGQHSSILDPSVPMNLSGALDPQQAMETTTEMQREAASFLGQAAAGSANPTIPIGSSSP